MFWPQEGGNDTSFAENHVCLIRSAFDAFLPEADGTKTDDSWVKILTGVVTFSRWLGKKKLRRNVMQRCTFVCHCRVYI